MSASSIQMPFEVFADRDGQPLEDGYIWLGVAGFPAISNPTAAYWDAGLTIQATQPIRTLNGYPVRSGSPSRIYVANDYSILVQNKNASTIYSSINQTERYSSSIITFSQAGNAAISRAIQSKLRETASVEDFGAVGDGSADDTVAINNALAAATHVTFTSGKTYKTTGTITVPTTCYQIDGAGAFMVGPGSPTGYSASVDGFYFTGFQQGPSTWPSWHQGFRSRNYKLPGLSGYRYGVSVLNAAFLNIYCDVISICQSAVSVRVTGGANNWGVQNIVKVALAVNCQNAIHVVCPAASVEGIQGCTFAFDYISGCNNGIYCDFDSGSSNFTWNIFRIGNLDGNGANNNPVVTYANAVYFTQKLTGGVNSFLFDNDPINMSPSAGVSPFINTDGETVAFAGRFIGKSFAPFYYDGFLPGGFRTTVRPAFNVMTIWVDQSLAVSGNGSVANPYKTIAEAFAAAFELDGFGKSLIIKLAAGTYSEVLSVDMTKGGKGNWQIEINGVTNTPASVVLTGGITITGGQIVLKDLTIQTAELRARENSYVRLTRVFFGASAVAHMNISTGAVVEVTTNYTISGGASVHVSTNFGGQFICRNFTVTLTGTPAFTSSFALAEGVSFQDWVGCTFSGSATGTRYSVTLNSCINTNGGGATFLPGSVGGTTATGGTYA